jgi:hypothetical protein
MVEFDALAAGDRQTVVAELAAKADA